MYGYWRKSDAFNPEIFAEGAVGILSEYPLDIVDLVTDPRTGLPQKLDYPATAKDIREACVAIVEARKRDRDRQTLLRHQFAAREAYEREQADRQHHPTQAELEQRLGRRLGERKPIPAARPDALWARWIEHRQVGATIHPEARQILEAAGYKIDGPDDQNPQKAA